MLHYILGAMLWQSRWRRQRTCSFILKTAPIFTKFALCSCLTCPVDRSCRQGFELVPPRLSFCSKRNKCTALLRVIR